MDSSAVKDLIKRWRSLNADRKDKNQELEDARQALAELDSRSGKVEQQWDMEKEGIKTTIAAIASQVAEKRNDLERIQRETEDLKVKVDERRQRNKEHLRILHLRQKNVTEKKMEADAKYQEAKERYQLFQTSLKESREQLLSAISKAENDIPREAKEHDAKKELLKNKIKEVSAVRDAESKSWALETAMKEWNRKSDARKYVLDDVNASEMGKDAWADALHELSRLNFKEMDRSLCELQSLIAI